MNSHTPVSERWSGFTLIELLVALLILSLLALMSYRGLGAVLDAGERVSAETDKWQRVSAFFSRFEGDIHLAAPRPVRSSTGSAAAWLGTSAATPLLEFSRFASSEGVDSPRRVGYALNDRHEIELWLWPGLDFAPGTSPARYPVLPGVNRFEIEYLNSNLAWVSEWPPPAVARSIPRGVRLLLELDSGETITRMFAPGS
ncbi:MAG: type II secretion system minor pseudopilin GspJ [Gammaproteobacteria bacterium]